MKWWIGLIILIILLVVFSLVLPILGEKIGVSKDLTPLQKTLKVVLYLLEAIYFSASFLLFHFYIIGRSKVWLSIILSFVSFLAFIFLGMLFTHLRSAKKSTHY